MIAGSHTARLLPRTKPKGRHPQKALSPAFIRSAPPGRHADENGLYLFVQPSGTRAWIQRLLIRGRRRELGLGSVTLVPMAEVREKALANRKLARQGEDPLAEKRRTEGIPTFAEAASRVLEQKRAGWRGPRHSQDWISSLRRLAFRRIGKAPVSEVTSADVLEILTPLWHRKVATAKRVRQRLRAVLEWAVAMEYGEVSSPEGTEKLLRPLGFTPQQAEWLTLVCLHSGLFTRDQVEAFFGYSKSSANRFIQALLRTRISHRPIASETITAGFAGSSANGGLNAALKKINQLKQATPEPQGLGMIDDFRLWGSKRCRRTHAPLTKVVDPL